MNSTRLDRKKKTKKKSKWLRYSLFTFFIILVGGGLYFYNAYNDVANAVNKMNKPISREISDKREEKVEFEKKDPISILMVGIDEREGDHGRTDSMLVLTVNPETKTTKIVSIPRDTRTKLINTKNPKKTTTDKINHAYAFGGIEMSIASVENFLNIPIDYYVEINMEGFKDIVDAVDGIDVDNQYAFELDGVTLKEGPQHLNGIKALAYSRMRHEDPRGDIGRGERQREVISKIIDKGKSLSTLTNYKDILDALENNIKTNLTLTEIIGMQSSYKPAAETIEKLEIEGSGKMINNVWYYMVEDQTRQILSDQLREQLGLTQEVVLNNTNSSSN
ncbi:LCP family protein [Bacillus sp. OK048]|uniref:LCP family glycopolymer transferase n=1 Tax=Bacillus sp. OK048 TaxID=1882761 RepID=UPI0008887635|nr:LCP family protein [Bacillus sp. OK048]SDM70107.1 transcriptional attenuator, LytR family [Bacillus sp. OK048]